MAKKTTNYSANTALIQGAAAAYKNYDNVAGMYAGLQQATQAGANLATAVIDKQSEENKKYNEAVKLYDDAADQVLLNSGTLSQKLYDSTYDELVKAKKIYLEGIDQKDDKKRIEGLKFIQNHSNWIQNHKAFNLQHAKDVKDGLMTSDYTAQELEIIAKIQNGDYTKTSRNEETGDVMFHLELPDDSAMSLAEFDEILKDPDKRIRKLHKLFKSETPDLPDKKDEDYYDKLELKWEEWKKKHRTFLATRKTPKIEKLVSSKEYEQLASIFKNDKVGVAHMEGKKYLLSQETFDADGYLVKVLGSLPSNESEWRGMVGNDLPGKRGGKQNLRSLLEQDMANGTLEAEIITALGIDITKFDTDGTPGLSDDEKANFIDAVVNVKNDDFHLETSNQILKERLLKEAEEEHTEHWRNKNEEKARLEAEQTRRFNLQNKGRDGLSLSYGFRTFDQMKTSYDLIQSTPPGQYYEGQSGRRFLRQEDGNYLAPDDSIFTPNQVKRYEQFNHLPDFDETSNTEVLDDALKGATTPVTFTFDEKIDDSVFSKTAQDAQLIFAPFQLDNDFAFETSKNKSKVKVFSTKNMLDGNPTSEIEINFNLENEADRKAEMQKLNNFFKELNK